MTACKGSVNAKQAIQRYWTTDYPKTEFSSPLVLYACL